MTRMQKHLDSLVGTVGMVGTITLGYDQRAPTLEGPFEDAGIVFTRTNPPTTFHRLRIESRNELIAYP